MRRNAAAALLMAALFIFCGRDAHAVGDPRRMQAQRTKAQQQTTVQMQAEVQARMKGPLEVEAEVFPVYMQQRHPLQDMNIDSYQIVDSFNPTTDEDYVVRFRKDSVQWINISEERKLKLVTFFIGEYRDKGITIGKPAEFYVNMIDQVAAQTPATLQQSLDRVVQVFAVIEYDFDNGQDKDLMARHVLGDKGFENNKRRLGLQ
jgi:hypothetical protein